MKNPLLKIVTFFTVAWIALVVGVCFQAAASGQAQTDPDTLLEEGSPTRTVSVNGIGQIRVEPDLAVIRLGVETQGETASETLAENSDAVQAVLDAMLEAGVDEEDLQTQNLSLFPRYEQSPESGGQGELLGYTARNVVRVNVRELDMVGDLLDAGIQAGANLVEGISFEVTNTADLLSQAREAAMEDAEQKATQLVTLAGAELGPVLSIQEFSSSPIPIERTEADTVGGRVPIASGTELIEIQVSVTWLIQGDSGVAGTEIPSTPDETTPEGTLTSVPTSVTPTLTPTP